MPIILLSAPTAVLSEVKVGSSCIDSCYCKLEESQLVEEMMKVVEE